MPKFIFLCTVLILIRLSSAGQLNVLPADSSVVKTDAEVKIYAFGQKKDLLRTAAAVTVLDRNSLQRTGQTSLVAAMNTVPGVKMDERSPGSYRISIRGNLLRSTFGVRNVKIYLNGLPFTDASGNTYFNELALNSIDNIEVIRGPGGSMYGAGTGGVILLNNDPVIKRSSAEVQGGSYGSFSAAGKYFFSKKNISQSVSYTHMQSKGYRQQSALRRDIAGYTLSAKTGTKNIITANVLYSDLFYETPGGLTPSQLAENPLQARPSSSLFPGATAQHAAIYLSTIYLSVSDEIRLSSKIKNTTGAYFTRTGFKNPAIRNYQQDDQKGFGGRSVFEFHSGKYAAALGTEYQYSFINTATYGNHGGVKDTVQYHDKIPVRQLNIFAQASAELPLQSVFTVGVSYNDFQYGFHRVSIPPMQDRADFKPQYIPRVSLSKNIDHFGSIYLSYSKGYSPPSIDEIHASDGIFNTALNAEQGRNYEAGIKAKLLKGRLYTELIGYIFQLRNTIVSRQKPGGAEYYVNAGSTRQQGLEFAANWLAIKRSKAFIRTVKLQNAVAYTHARFADYQKGTVNFSGNKLTGTPPFVFSMLADIHTSVGIYTNLTYTYTDKIPLNDANTYFAKAYNVLSVKLGCQRKLSRAFSPDIFISMQKGFNKNYSLGNDLNADANRFYNPAALQVFTAGVVLGM